MIALAKSAARKYVYNLLLTKQSYTRRNECALKDKRMADLNDSGNNLEEDGSPDKMQHRKILLLTLPVVVIALAAIIIYFTGLADSLFAVKDVKNPAEQSMEAEEIAVDENAVFFEVPEMLLNLSVRAGQKPVYFKVKAVLELASELDKPKVEKMLPRVVDSMQFYLREMRLEELQGSMGTYRLKEELTGRMNKVLAPVQVKDVLLKEILIQ